MIGTGLSAIETIENLKKNKKKFIVFESSENKKKIPPKKNILKNPLIFNNLFGGFSNYWGGACFVNSLKFLKNYQKSFPYMQFKSTDIKEEIIQKKYLKINFINAVNNDDKIFNAKSYFKNKKDIFFSYKVIKIEILKNNLKKVFYIHKDKQNIIFVKNIFLCCGVMSNLRILYNSDFIPKDITLSQSTMFLCLYFKNQKIDNKFYIKDTKNKFFYQIYNDITFILEIFLPKKLTFFLKNKFNKFLSFFSVSLIYLNSNISSQYVYNLKNNKLKKLKNNVYNLGLKEKFRKVEKDKSVNLFCLFRLKLDKFQSFHYKSNLKKTLFSKFSYQYLKKNNIFILDSSLSNEVVPGPFVLNTLLAIRNTLKNLNKR